MVDKQKNGFVNKQNPIKSQNIMDFGTLFEPAHRIVIESMFESTILETSMI